MTVRRRFVLGCVAAIVAATQVSTTSPAIAHPAVTSTGVFWHQVHSRDITIWNQMNSAKLRDQTRNAQLQLHSIYNGSLRFNTASSSSSAVIVAVDAYYDDTFIGRAYNWGPHNGQGRFQFNTRIDVTDDRARGTACHEISHFTGLQHTSDATDCMKDALYSMTNFSLGTGHRDQMRTTWNNSGH